jgi:dihydrofolate synthase/folylpolyglutamate synthase
MDYHQAWKFLDQLQFFKIKLGLDSMNTFLARLGKPHRTLPCIHVGGTNGKGSVGATLHSILATAGYKTGFYTSPHLSSVRERFTINGSYISENDFARLITRIADVLDGDQITYFECTTTLAMLWFCEQKVDFAILEVGMGGRLDATNVVTPLLSIITNVSMDHEQYLGDTLEQVAIEKAGIIKPEIPVVSGAANDISAAVIATTCSEKKAPLYLFNRDFSAKKTGRTSTFDYTGIHGEVKKDLPLAMKGHYQISNASLALAAIELLQDKKFSFPDATIRKGLAHTRWPGRLESFRLNAKNKQTSQQQGSLHFLLDGAHNPAGVAALKTALTEEFSYARLILLWGAMADKDLHTTLDEIAPLADSIIFTAPQSDRSASGEQLQRCLPEKAQVRVIVTKSVREGIAAAKKLATHDDLICIAGSLYLVGEARQLLMGGLVSDG